MADSMEGSILKDFFEIKNKLNAVVCKLEQMPPGPEQRELVACIADAVEDAHFMRGMVNVLADKLARETGRTVPCEIARARKEVAKPE